MTMTYQANIGTEQTKENVIAMPTAFFEKFGSVVEDLEDRAMVVPKHLKGSVRGTMQFEALVCHMAKEVCETSDVSLWDFAEVGEAGSASAFMMYPARNESFKVVNHNTYSEMTVDSHIFGVMVNMMTFSHASFYYEHIDSHLSQAFAAQYHALKNAFYGTVDAMVHESSSTSTAEEKEQISAMSSAVWSYLD